MCTVQVLLFADVMRRNDPSYVTGPRTGIVPRSICRKLFADDATSPGRTDFLRNAESQMQKEAKERWNFDFFRETPLPGRYQWVPVRPGAARAAAPTNSTVDEVKSSGSTHSKTDTPTKSKTQQTAKSKSNKLVIQSKITDFLQQRKRHRTQDMDLIPSSPKLKSRRLMDSAAMSN